MLENYEGTALDTEMFNESVQPETEPETPQTGSDETVDPQESGISEKFNIPGLGEYTVDEIKEWKQGNLRQSDYTKKTQDLARQRETLQRAEELYNYVTANPHLIDAMRQAERGDVPAIRNASPEMAMLQELAYNQKSLEVDMKLNALKEKYPDIDEVALFDKATELQTEDLEFVWKGLMAEKNTVDIAAIKEQLKAELKAELESNKNSVSTTVSTSQSSQRPTQTYTLSDEEKRVASAMDMSEDEYARWMQG